MTEYRSNLLPVALLARKEIVVTVKYVIFIIIVVALINHMKVRPGCFSFSVAYLGYLACP